MRRFIKENSLELCGDENDAQSSVKRCLYCSFVLISCPGGLRFISDQGIYIFIEFHGKNRTLGNLTTPTLPFVSDMTVGCHESINVAGTDFDNKHMKNFWL